MYPPPVSLSTETESSNTAMQSRGERERRRIEAAHRHRGLSWYPVHHTLSPVGIHPSHPPLTALPLALPLLEHPIPPHQQGRQPARPFFNHSRPRPASTLSPLLLLLPPQPFHLSRPSFILRFTIRCRGCGFRSRKSPTDLQGLCSRIRVTPQNSSPTPSYLTWVFTSVL